MASNAIATGSASGPSTAVRDLNDQLRRKGRGGRVVATAGIASLPPAEQAAIIAAIRVFNDFGPDNDPYGEHVAPSGLSRATTSSGRSTPMTASCGSDRPIRPTGLSPRRPG